MYVLCMHKPGLPHLLRALTSRKTLDVASANSMTADTKGTTYLAMLEILMRFTCFWLLACWHCTCMPMIPHQT